MSIISGIANMQLQPLPGNRAPVIINLVILLVFFAASQCAWVGVQLKGLNFRINLSAAYSEK